MRYLFLITALLFTGCDSLVQTKDDVFCWPNCDTGAVSEPGDGECWDPDCREECSGLVAAFWGAACGVSGRCPLDVPLCNARADCSANCYEFCGHVDPATEECLPGKAP